jgi:hypothetical protein
VEPRATPPQSPSCLHPARQDKGGATCAVATPAAIISDAIGGPGVWEAHLTSHINILAASFVSQHNICQALCQPKLQVDQERHDTLDTVLATSCLCLKCLCCEPPGPNMMPQGQTTNNQSVSHTCSFQSRSYFVSSIYTQALSKQEDSTGSSPSVKTRKV